MSALVLDKIRKRFDANEVLKGIDISLADGEFLVLLGPSGCGKSTLLNIIAGLLEPTSGDVRIGDRSVLGVRPKNRDIAMVFQSYALYPNMSVERNIGFGLEMRGVPAAERREAVHEAAAVLHIEPLLKRRPGELSGGQRQRVAIGRALVRNPAVFLFDEPLSNLDAKLRMEMRGELRRLHDMLGTTIVYVTHDQIEAMTLASRIALMHNGLIEQIGTPEEIYNRPANLYVAGFVGSPAMNVLEATLHHTAEGLVATLVQSGETIRLPLGQIEHAPPDGARVSLGIRPEAVRLALEGEAGAVKVRIDDVELTGPEKLVVAHLGGATFTARVSPHARIRPGDTATFAFDAVGVNLFDPNSGARL
jgi:multiple sugar transport system ATP-binding protein